jgi:thioredoxin 1
MKKLIYFSADWCHPCKTFGPLLAGIATSNNIPLQHVNVDNNRELTMQYHIKSIPTVLLVENDQVINTFVGPKPESEILKFWNN